MCASVYSLLLFTLTIACVPMSADARPVYGQDKGVLAGADFLSVFMSSSLRQEYRETTSPEPLVRDTRSTFAQTDSTEGQTSLYDSDELHEIDSKQSSESVATVRTLVSGTISREEETGAAAASSTMAADAGPVAAEERPSAVAGASKSEFSVDEREPITSNSDLAPEFRSYPASVQPLSNSQFNHQTLIFHNEPGKARSVSYSTVIQAVPQKWDDKHERHERHYDGAAYANNFAAGDAKANDTDETTRKSFITTERNWEHQEKPYSPPTAPRVYGQPEQNYEVDESASVMTNGRVHGVQPVHPTLPTKEVKSTKVDDNQKVGYVVEGRNYRKYRVEERTSDGFIVGEYGVVSHDDGSLRGVRYTADGTISPRLIYDALMKFLSL